MVKQSKGEELNCETYGCPHRLRSCCACRHKLCYHNSDCRAVGPELNVNDQRSRPNARSAHLCMTVACRSRINEKGKKRKNDQRKPQQHSCPVSLWLWGERVSETADHPFCVPQWQGGHTLYRGSLPHSWRTHALYVLPISAAQHFVARFPLKLSRNLSSSHARWE